jgi:predicted dehydrogenase
MLDVLQWYFGDTVTVDQYDDDSLGGVEGNAELSLTFDGPRSVSGTAAFSHTRRLDNRVTISGERGRIEASLGHPDHDESVESVHFCPAGDEGDHVAVTFENATNCSTDWLTRLRLQIAVFVDAVAGGEARYAPAESGLLVVDLIDECYGRRDLTPHPWERDRAAELTADGGDGSA